MVNFGVQMSESTYGDTMRTYCWYPFEDCCYELECSWRGGKELSKRWYRMYPRSHLASLLIPHEFERKIDTTLTRIMSGYDEVKAQT